ncbi:MAG TPA: glycosyltransferase [Pyrinomonadaceae bacterium]|nr:glycosyltransferase [Pyrinomonadaceae bacterium]
MKWAGIVDWGRKFQRATKSGGLVSAVRKSIKGVASRSGLVPLEQFEILANEVQSLRHQIAEGREREAILRQRIVVSHEDLAIVRNSQVSLESQYSNQPAFAEASQLTALASQLETLAASVQSHLNTQQFETHAASVQSHLNTQSDAIGWLAEHHWTTGPLNPPVAIPAQSPLVSVIMPVWNRENLVSEAIQSVCLQIYQNWELIVVDDGSTDKSAESIAAFLDDKRIRYFHIAHKGQAAARNVGLKNSRGQLIAYLDSDDIWYPAFLARMVEAFNGAPDRDWAYAAKLFSDPSDGTHRIFDIPAERTSLLAGNAVPMTALVHRRSLIEQVGMFDEQLERLVDWDLVVRFMAQTEPLQVPVLGGQCRLGSWPRVSNQLSHALAYFQVQRKHRPGKKVSARILYALQFFPQLSETFVITEISAMRERGIDIVVWSEYDPPVPFECDVPVVRGDLGEAIAQVRPDMVHVHSLYQAQRYAPMVSPTGVPMTVRGHGFEYSEELLQEVSTAAAVRRVFEFPHFITGKKLEGLETEKLRAMTACFNPNLYFPKGESDPRLVVRAGLASPSKHMDAFIRIAAMCPRHRFVLLACWSTGYPDHFEELQSLNRSLGEPVEILLNRPRVEVSELMQRAGIHLHTHTLVEPYGMPVSIAESMAAGCYVIARRCPASIEYVGEAGKTYDTESEAAALVLETEHWTKEEWGAAHLASVDRAFTHYPSQVVLQPLLDEWTSASVETLVATA